MLSEEESPSSTHPLVEPSIQIQHLELNKVSQFDITLTLYLPYYDLLQILPSNFFFLLYRKLKDIHKKNTCPMKNATTYT